MEKMRLVLLCAFLILQLQCFSQKSILYKFCVDQPSVDTATGAYYGMQFEFISERVYSSDNEFFEKGLFVKDSSQKAAIYFRKSGSNWYIKNFGSKWKIFHSNAKQKPTPTIRINGKIFSIKWKKEEVFEGNLVAVFVLKPNGFISNHQPDYIFDYKKGVIGLRTADVTLVRFDLK